MKKIMKVSLALLTIPLIFIGCMQEKVSKVSPEAKDINQTKTTKQEVKGLKNISKIEALQVNNNGVKTIQENQLSNNSTLHVTNNGIKLIPNTNQNNLIVDSTILDELALNIQNSMDKDIDIDMDLYGSTEPVTQSLEVGENWEAFTKKDEILETAKAYLYVPYVWAANGPSSFDCSGFTKYVFREHGITIPRYSGHQANVGIKVSYDELQKGDLVFFDTSKGFHKKVNHVGIYIGNNQFIHASSAKKEVTITSFEEKQFYKRRFLLGRRVVDTDSSFASYNGSTNLHRN